MGLKPGNPDGTYTQDVPLWGIHPSGTMSITLQAGRELTLTPGQDYFLSSTMPQADISIANSKLVFVGYGVVAPEYHWDDYKNVDVKGKTVFLLSGDPPVPDPNDPSKLDEKMFLGKALSYYGRPATKYEEAYRRGAIACITLYAPRTGAANLSRMVQNAPRESMILRDGDSKKRISAQVSLSAAKAQELFAASGQDFEKLRKAAVRPGLSSRSTRGDRLLARAKSGA